MLGKTGQISWISNFGNNNIKIPRMLPMQFMHLPEQFIITFHHLKCYLQKF